jgi:pyruvate kinase
MPIATRTRDLPGGRRTKIVATLGPASAAPDMVERLIRAGVDVFRLNLSHGEHAEHEAAFRAVREAAARLGTHTAVLADLCGPKMRTGCFEGGRIEIVAGAPVTVTVRDVLGGPGLIPSQYDALASDVKTGDRILLDDGNLELRVEAVEGSEIACTVLVGGTLKDRKGLNLPGAPVSAVSLTEKDQDDALFALALGVDWLALSFVRKAADVRALRALVSSSGGDAGIVAKIERPEALESIDEIFEESDAIIVARGDLGVELRPELVPVVQAQLVEKGRARGRPVIVAAQMMESMISRPRPTRAEVADVAAAAWGGTDAVLLSAETASGAYPVEAVEMVDRAARAAEAYLFARGGYGVETPAPAPLARDPEVRAIVAFTRSGRTASVLSARRPRAPVLARSVSGATCRRMQLCWGVVPILGPDIPAEGFPAEARRLAMNAGLARDGDATVDVGDFAAVPAEEQPSVVVLRGTA